MVYKFDKKDCILVSLFIVSLVRIACQKVGGAKLNSKSKSLPLH
jgi:hypothetical protein